MKKIVTALLLLVLTASAAAAQPGGPRGPRPGGPGPRPGGQEQRWRPGPPPRRHFRHWDGCGALAAGLLLGAVISDQAQTGDAGENERLARQEEERREVEAVKAAARDIAEKENENIRRLISERGVDGALTELNNFWQSNGHPTHLNAQEPLSVLTVAGFQREMTLLYSVDRAKEDVTVTVNAPTRNISERSSSKYLAARRTDIAELLGFSCSENSRDAQKRFVVGDVVEATAADYAGIRKGMTLLEVDGNSTAQVSAEQMGAYLARREKAGASCTLKLQDAGKIKTVKIKL